MSSWHDCRTTRSFTGWQPVYLRRAILLVSSIVLWKRSCHFMSLKQPWLNVQGTKKQSTGEKKENLREEGKKKRNYCKSTIFPDQNLVFRQHKTCQALSAVEWLDLCISARFTEEIYARNTNWITGPPPFLHKREELLHFWSSCCLYGSWLLGLCSDHKTSACNFYLLPVIVSRTILSLQCKLE